MQLIALKGQNMTTNILKLKPYVKPTWVRNPLVKFVHLFHPPLPTPREVKARLVVEAEAELNNAQRQLEVLRYDVETQEGIVLTNEKRLHRLHSEDL